MQYKQTKTWFFIVYLGLLLNLGPSLHHADFFGLHGHSVVSSCSCCPAHTIPCSNDSPDGATVKGTAEHDCAFCKFFDQYHVIVDAVDVYESSAFAALLVAQRPVDADSASFIPVARGPPATV